MKIQCPDCSQELRIEASLVGKRVRCPCGREMIVGKPAASALPVTQTAPKQTESQPAPNSQDEDPDWPPPEYRDLFKSETEREREHEDLPPQVARASGPRPTLRRQMSGAEKCRRQYSSNEAGIINTGFYFILTAVTLLMLAVALFPDLNVLQDATKPNAQKEALPALYLSLAVAACSLFFWIIGLGLRSFQNWARILGTIVIFPLYFAFPVGSITAGFLSASMNTKEAKFVFSRKHQHARRLTPQLRPRHSAFSWIVAGIFTLVVFGIPLWLLCLQLTMR